MGDMWVKVATFPLTRVFGCLTDLDRPSNKLSKRISVRIFLRGYGDESGHMGRFKNPPEPPSLDTDRTRTAGWERLFRTHSGLTRKRLHEGGKLAPGKDAGQLKFIPGVSLNDHRILLFLFNIRYGM